MADTRKEQQHEEAARNARALVDPDDPPRCFFVGVAYDNGSDFSHGVNKASAEQGEAVLDVMETLATHINVVARITGQDRTEIAGRAVGIARGQEALGEEGSGDGDDPDGQRSRG